MFHCRGAHYAAGQAGSIAWLAEMVVGCACIVLQANPEWATAGQPC